MGALKRLNFWQWLLIGFGAFIAVDLFVISRLLPLDIWVIWFNIKAGFIFVVLPIGGAVILFLTRK